MLFSETEVINLDTLKEIMKTFYYSSLLPIKFIDTNLEIKSSFPNPSIFDSAIVLDETRDYKKIMDILSQRKLPKKCFIFTNNFNFSYISLSIWYKNIFKGILIVGPFLLLSPNSQDIDIFIEKHKMPLSIKPALIEFYKELKVIEHTRLVYLSKSILSLTESNIDLYDNPFLNDKEMSIRTHETYSYNIIKNREENFKRAPYTLTKDLHNYVKLGDLDNAKKIKKKLSEYKMVELPGVSHLRNAKNHLIIHCSSLAQSAVEGEADEDFIFTLKDSYISLIESCTNISDLITLSNNMLKEFTDSVNNLGKVKINPAVQKSIKYIYEHLTENLSLHQVSEEVGLHPKYFSSLFKKEMGITFQNYISKLRIHEAKRLLDYSDYSILDIALQLGFKNQSYFTNTFKKYEECTPNQYRKKKKTQIT